MKREFAKKWMKKALEVDEKAGNPNETEFRGF
jgi:hypothetical protein